MKVTELLESLDNMLKTLIQRRLDKEEKVKLDFFWPPEATDSTFHYDGVVTQIAGNTIHSLYDPGGGEPLQNERFVLPRDADYHLTLNKSGDGWLVQKI